MPDELCGHGGNDDSAEQKQACRRFSAVQVFPFQNKSQCGGEQRIEISTHRYLHRNGLKEGVHGQGRIAQQYTQSVVGYKMVGGGNDPFLRGISAAGESCQVRGSVNLLQHRKNKPRGDADTDAGGPKKPEQGAEVGAVFPQKCPAVVDNDPEQQQYRHDDGCQKVRKQQRCHGEGQEQYVSSAGIAVENSIEGGNSQRGKYQSQSLSHSRPDKEVRQAVWRKHIENRGNKGRLSAGPQNSEGSVKGNAGPQHDRPNGDFRRLNDADQIAGYQQRGGVQKNITIEQG